VKKIIPAYLKSISDDGKTSWGDRNKMEKATKQQEDLD